MEMFVGRVFAGLRNRYMTHVHVTICFHLHFPSGKGVLFITASPTFCIATGTPWQAFDKCWIHGEIHDRVYTAARTAADLTVSPRSPFRVSPPIAEKEATAAEGQAWQAGSWAWFFVWGGLQAVSLPALPGLITCRIRPLPFQTSARSLSSSPPEGCQLSHLRQTGWQHCTWNTGLTTFVGFFVCLFL